MLKQFVKKLPVYHQTETQKQFFAATIDQLFNPANVEPAQGFIGRRSGSVLDVDKDIYLDEPTRNRANYQLEPISYSKDSNTLDDTNHVFYEDIINRLSFYGSDTSNHDRLFSDTYYSFAPPIDIDKFVNYGNYVWITEDIVPVFIEYIGTDPGITIDTIINDEILGQVTFNTSDVDNLSPPNFAFTNGVRVKFEGSTEYTDTYIVDGVGSSIRFLGPISAQTPNTLSGGVPWDSAETLEWDNFIWDGSTVEIEPPRKSYITIQRGACDGNVWSRTNRWLHIEAINAVQRVGQVIDATLVDGGLGYDVGDKIDVDGDGSGGVIEVTAVDGLGTITDFVISLRGAGYTIASVDETGQATSTVDMKWDALPAGDGTDWDAEAWDQSLPTSRTGAIFDIELASAIDKTNRAERPIIEYFRDIELYDHGKRYNGEVDLAATVSTPADIIGQVSATVDGIPLSNGMLLIFQNAETLPEFIEWDAQAWDSVEWDIKGLPAAVTKFVWQVGGVGTSITLEKFNLETGVVDPAAPAAELGDSVLVRNGLQFAGVPFYQAETDSIGQTWVEGQTTSGTNVHPLFMLYDYRGIPLDDVLEFEDSNFQGGEIFSYRIYDGEDLGENEFVSFDRILEFDTVRTNLGQVGDILFENDLEVTRYTYVSPLATRTEIPGYYFYNQYTDPCSDDVNIRTESTFLTNWKESTGFDKQRYVNQFLTVEDNESIFRISVTPVNEDIQVRVDGRKLGDDEFSYSASLNAIILNNPPSEGTIVETFTYTFDRVDDDLGFFEVPRGLESNPNNREITENSWNDFIGHFVSIIENQSPYFGDAFGVSNNYRDTARDGSVGRKILQNQSPLLKSMLVTSSEELDLVEAIRMSSREYTRYKNKLLKVVAQLMQEGFTGFNTSDPIVVNQWLDESIRRIIQTREFADAFVDTYMLSWTNVFVEEELTGNNVNTVLTVTNFVDLEDRRNAMYIYIDGVQQVSGVDYDIVNLNPIQLEFVTPPLIGNDVRVRLYTGTSPAHIPATPAKLGIVNPVRPRIETDNTYRTPVDMVVGHDGSRTPVFGDFRDDVLLEFETRIYNGILELFRDEYAPAVRREDVAPGFFRDSRWSKAEYEEILRQSFFKWAMVNKADHRANTSFELADEWTWNYSSIIVNNKALPGYWRGIFDYFYDTQTPESTPWEMLGFSTKPDWWENGDGDTIDGWLGYGTGPWPATHQMWEDIENGIIRRGERIGELVAPNDGTEPLPKARVGDLRFARPGLVANYLPVDNSGALKATPMEAIGYTGTLPTPDQAAADWKFGDFSPVEYAWRTSESYPFALSETLFLTKPAAFGEKFFNAENFLITPANDKQVVSRRDGIFKRIGNSIQTVHGETRGGELILNTGYQVWISSRLKSLGRSIGTEFGDKVRNLNVKLGHKMGGFTDKETTRVFVEGLSVNADTSNLLVPSENIDVRLFTGAPVKEYFYGGVVVQTTNTGTYKVYGYNILKGSFTYLERKQSPKDRKINMAGKPEKFVNYESGRIYEKGTIIRLNGTYHRALVTHESTRFNPANWQKLAALPVRGGVTVTYKPVSAGTTKTIEYGHEFSTPQEVFDFIIGYGDQLENEGWAFDNVNSQSNTVENWLNAGKEYLFWVATNWEEGNAIVLSPAARNTDLTVGEGYPMAVEKTINGVYSILDQNGMAIDPVNTKVQRNDRNIKVIPTISGQEVYALRVNTAETETIITFDNVTEFNDVLYDPLLGSRQQRLLFNGRKTKGWTGKLEAAGFIITENGLLPNFENLVDSIRFYHDTEKALYDPRLEAVARHLTGHVERDHLTSLDILDDAQYNFYQGMIRQKGTQESIGKLERSEVVTALDDELKIHEEWAIRAGEFGGVVNRQMSEFFIEADTIKVDPQLVELFYEQSEGRNVREVQVVTKGQLYNEPPDIFFDPDPRSTAQKAEHPFPAIATLNSDGTLASIEVVDNRGNYSTPPKVLIGSNQFADIEEDSDRAIAILGREITEDTPGDDIITIDLDDREKWITRPAGTATDIPNSLWPTTNQKIFNTPNAGYVHKEDVTHEVFDIENLQSLWSLPKPPARNDMVWAARAENREWAVYKMTVGPKVVRQYSANDTDAGILGLGDIEVTASLQGTGYLVGDTITVNGLPGTITIEDAIIRVTDVDTGGEVLAVEVDSPGQYTIQDHTSTSPVALPATPPLSGGSGSGVEIAVTSLTNIVPPQGLVRFDEGAVPLPDPANLPTGRTALRYLRNTVLIEGIVLKYEPYATKNADGFYILSIDDEPIEDGALNAENEYASNANGDMESDIFYNLRFKDIAEWNADPDNTLGTPSPGDTLAERIWIDENSDGKWTVRNVNIAGDTLDPHRTEPTLVDTSAFDGAYIYDVVSKDTLVQLPIYDPFKGTIPGIADNEIKYRSKRDPARYNRDAEELSDPRLYRPSAVFGATNVGELWWDTSTCAYIWYEQPTSDGDAAELSGNPLELQRRQDRYRRDNWGSLFTGSSIDVYEWTRSTSPPADYEGDGTVRNTTDFVEMREWDPLIEEIRTFYYFWVKDVPEAPGTKNRRLSASEVARTIRNPRTQLYKWYSPISQSGFVFSGIDGVFTDSDNIFQINFKQLDNDNIRHVEWELVSESDIRTQPNDRIWNKMVDSLVGYTNLVPIGNSKDTSFPPLNNFNNALPLAGDASQGYLIVPDPALNELNSYGVLHRPLQSMFVNRSNARKIFAQAVNELLADILLRDEDPNWNADLPSNNLWEWVNWYATGFNENNVQPTRQVPNTGSLDLINDPFPGEIIKINAALPSYYAYDPEQETFVLIAKEDVRMRLKDAFYENIETLQSSLEIRAIIETMKNRVFASKERSPALNRIFFSMLNYVFKEQADIDWAFKSTYVTIEQTGKPIIQEKVFQADPYDNVFDYMQEVKPYQTKIRDYKVTRAADIDLLDAKGQELERDLKIRLLYDRFTCSLSITEMRIAKSAALADPTYDGYTTLFSTEDNADKYIHLGAAGRFVVSQTDLLDEILYIDSNIYEDYIPRNAYWDTSPWDSESWDGSAGTTQAELAAVAEINDRLCEELRRFFDGVEANSTALVGSGSTIPWDEQGWDSTRWDTDLEPDDTDVLDASLDGSFGDIPPEDTFIADGTQREFLLTTDVPTFFLFAQVFNTDGDAISTVLNVDYFFISGKLVFVTAPLAGHTVNVYTYLESGDFINPSANDQVTEEMVPLDPRENLVVVADTVDDPNTPTVSYSFRIHYDTQRTNTYLRQDTLTMTRIAATVGYTDDTIAVDDVSVLEEQPTTFEAPNVAWICNERIVFHGVDPVNNLLLGVQRGTLGTPLAVHGIDCKVFAGGPAQEIPNPEVYWVSPSATNTYNGVDGQWRDNADKNAIFSDLSANAFAAQVVPGDTIVATNTNIAGTYLIKELIAAGSLSTVTITNAGSGYEIGDPITVAGNGTAIVGAVDGIGAVTAVTITDFGSGYGAGPESMTAVDGDGTFTASVSTDREAIVIAHVAPLFSATGRIVEANSVTWSVNKLNSGGLLASNTDAANFILLQQGDALPCCPGLSAQWIVTND